MKKNTIAILLLLIIVLVILVGIFKPVLQHPNSYLFSHGGDAVKSYFNFSYHLKYGDGIKYQGINYPYGEHLQFINSHPVYLAIFKPISRIIPLENYGVAILNLLMIFSILLTAPFIFLILRKFKLPRWYALIVALIILFLSPQFDRIKGHFEMTHLFYIPMFWYFLLRFREGNKTWIWGALLILSALMGGFTSAYFVAFYAIFLFSVLLADIWNYRKNLKVYLKPGLIFLAMIAIPLIIVKGSTAVTDWANDRPDNPWGFYVFHANPFSIFLPPNQNIHFLFDKWFKISYQWEGRAYIGLPATLLAIGMIVSSIYYLVQKKKTSILFMNKELNTYLLGATLVLLFSMCIPFKFGFGFLLEILPPVRQFRALGRFAWIFYYVFTVYAAYQFYHLYLKLKEKGMPSFAFIFLSFMMLAWSFDAAINTKKSFSGIFLSNDKLESNDIDYLHMLQEANINIDTYQAIFFLPYANTSGDKLLFEEGMNAFSEAMKCSYHTALPLIESFSPRLPFSNALSSVQMLADSCIRKTRLDDMNEQAILLVMTNEQMTAQEQWMKSHASTLLSYENVTLAHFEPTILEDSYTAWLQYVDSVKATLIGTENIKANVSLDRIYTLNFDEYQSDQVFTGSGAFFERRNGLEVFNEKFSDKGIIGSYELSFWMYFDTRMYDMPQPKIHIFNEDGKLEKTIRLNNRQIHNVFNSWVRVEQQLNIEASKRYQLSINGKYVTIDDLLLKPLGCNVWQNSSNTELFNNFALPTH